MEEGLTDRLIAAGDIVIFMPPLGNKRAIKHLTIGKEYFVESVIIRDQAWSKVGHTAGKFVKCSPHVDTIHVVNDKGTKFSYSANHFLIAAEGIHFSMAQVEDKNIKEFMEGLRDL